MENKKPVFLIRHAQSQHNVDMEKAKEKHKDFFGAVQYEVSHYNCDISELGYQQTAEAREKLKDKNIKIVLTSPIRRAMITAREIFKDHPSKPKIYVVASLREKCNAVSGMAGHFASLEKEFPDFDFSPIANICKESKEIFLVESVVNDDLRAAIKKEILELKIENDAERVKDFMIKKLKELHPEGLESQLEIY
eukprot:CAMPEP_0114587004 /NCGR_PEP_ID=MMETSP0125-20121206/10084_1 /TAXON_ID=485358 ORGANISM="Aristerostoma sp., Strain ATCC 50986" /NCGR_SAMPLE_ID=MMETSP0125 /ASSEMBLY_ACC=CAM_ASM_000245 /LENGTH=193 /DNA_ID=CAMNT_0001782721 /DNA_START=35 /DNA_END=616 /DNA_ORIENTATION=+